MQVRGDLFAKEQKKGNQIERSEKEYPQRKGKEEKWHKQKYH